MAHISALVPDIDITSWGRRASTRSATASRLRSLLLDPHSLEVAIDHGEERKQAIDERREKNDKT